MTHSICDTWGRVTTEETDARRSLSSSMRLVYISRWPHTDTSVRKAGDEFDRLVNSATTLSQVFEMLSGDQHTELRRIVENPAVKVRRMDGTYWWIDAEKDVLGRLESGTPVGSPDEKHIARQAGDKAIT